MLEICAIASGSNGNCYYVGNEKDAVLIDAGISCKQILKRMDERGLNPLKIKAVFISHEHSDHVRGVRVLAKKLNVPVYFTAKTFYAAHKTMQPAYPRFFEPGESINTEEFTIHSFLKNHDASEPCSFRIEYAGKNVGVFTDIGEPCENVITHIGLCNAVFLESNYDEKMLETGPYPYYLKRRVASSHGHLSNVQSFKLLNENAGAQLKYVFLSHLSAENNTPEIALAAHQPNRSKYEVRLTSRFGPTDVFVL
ncbi:Phosphoribosyl 1,2-cyclic phosphodiesterase [Mariniphaga anaerophila]|uniref:Phosphoribosyl 1,2-cyclic phosphodiesterase n=1 Tax=Mariniphaga anaerophila TaxID=1484053 RepID=A0A1M5DH67_9BACT|nr:MBL fold metallo-hydrolase [Mariniphaga anaerophila]SHF66327.1 Phosphoribosyl 1,2-cyclic phosphodiesterase [Mariniphaga anaerophila]